MFAACGLLCMQSFVSLSEGRPEAADAAKVVFCIGILFFCPVKKGR